MRAGVVPLGREVVLTYLPKGRNVSLALTPVGGGVAASRDLAYTYGNYQIQQGAQIKEKGHYAHIWKRDSKGEWKIVVSNLEQEKAN